MKRKGRRINFKRVIMLGLIILFITIITNKTYSEVEYKFDTIYAAGGDTLWAIALDQQKNNIYYKGKKVRDIISDIRSINNLDTSYIYEGQALLIPVV